MGTIQPLSSLLISQISAGEVVRDPSGIVKELVENALDAGARSIEVIIEKGGMQRIGVLDDGSGMAQDDLVMALTRHATSKLQAFEDLESLETLGFRGEALASMAAVSRLSLASRTASQTEGFEVSGKEGAMQPVRMAVGTRVDIHDLFYNTPARRKFMRTERTEFGYIDQVVKHFALKHLGVNFLLKHNDRVMRDVKAVETEADQTARLRTLLGADFAANAVAISHRDAHLSVEGWLARPLYSRAHPDVQIFFLNNRLIRDKGLSHAVKRAYQDIMLPNRYPAFVLFLTLDSKAVDINIHPAKQEVKFQDARAVAQALYYAVHRALIEDGLPKKQMDYAVSVPSQEPLRQALQASRPVPIMTEAASSSAEDTQVYVDRLKSQLTETVPIESEPPPQQQMLKPETLQPTLVADEGRAPPLGYAIGQVKGVYVLAQNIEGLVVVDMHAAHERIVYERLKKEHRDQGVVRQALLMPETVTLSLAEATCLEEKRDLLLSFGIECDLMGDQEGVVRSTPALLGKTDAGRLLNDVLSDLTALGDSVTVESAVNRLLGTLACHTAIRANRSLSITEMNALLRDIEATEHSGYCNHGRPTHKVFSLKAMDAWFHRGQ